MFKQTFRVTLYSLDRVISLAENDLDLVTKKTQVALIESLTPIITTLHTVYEGYKSLLLQLIEILLLFDQDSKSAFSSVLNYIIICRQVCL